MCGQIDVFEFDRSYLMLKIHLGFTIPELWYKKSEVNKVCLIVTLFLKGPTTHTGYGSFGLSLAPPCPSRPLPYHLDLLLDWVLHDLIHKSKKKIYGSQKC